MFNYNLPFTQKQFQKLAGNGLAYSVVETVLDDVLLDFELFYAQGLKFVKEDNVVFFKTTKQSIRETTFCIVDIETNGSKIQKHQIIELAALKIQNGKIIDRFESFVYCENINPAITGITGISVEDTITAPPLKDVLIKFREFLHDSVFIAHDVKFDYNFISASFQKIGMAPLLNRYICSIDLAERTIVSYRYGLAYLNKYFNLYPDAKHHRAMSDVMTTYKLFIKILENLPSTIVNAEELIRFSKNEKRLKRPKIDPMIGE